ncbi:MAG TPA: M23 family metallopeptidase [Candidatus Peribacteraceae bacterium]|nr:M23 family metallopeptidase [Candidatus Peribacteraceae bacterium]
MFRRTDPAVVPPIDPYDPSGTAFGERCTIDGIDWGVHLGDDLRVKAGTPVRAVADGTVVYARFIPGSPVKRNWGGIVIVRHRFKTGTLYSLYGHIVDKHITVGQRVKQGQEIGAVAEKLTPRNGWWRDEHLHFGLYRGPWNGKVLPGFYREDQELTRPEWWLNPVEVLKVG